MPSRLACCTLRWFGAVNWALLHACRKRRRSSERARRGTRPELAGAGRVSHGDMYCRQYREPSTRRVSADHAKPLDVSTAHAAHGTDAPATNATHGAHHHLRDG